MNQLNGKRALITGGASGIGRATAILFAQEGAAVAIVDINSQAGLEVVQAIQRNGGQATFIRCDVTDGADCQAAVTQVTAALGGLDILVNNAGVIRRASVVESCEEDWDLVMNVNVRSIFLISKYAIPVIAKAGGGAIINMASGWGLRGGRRAAAYCAAKGAVVNLTRAMALDHAEQGIRVNCVCPGDTDTPMLRDEARQLGEPVEAFLSESADRPLARIAAPEEIAQAVLFLASEASSYATGSALVVDGGGLAG